MFIAYWIVASLLAALYLFSGGMKVVRSKDKLRPMMGWVDSVPLLALRAIGIIEVLGAIGLILPPLTGIASQLAFIAAIGFVVVQMAAIVLHVSRGETRQLGFNAVLIVLAGALTWLATIWL